jgi:hypothetical protein
MVSYSAITNYRGKVTLPCIDSGLGSLYVVKDPPKAIFTRRIDKVGQTSSITDMRDDSGDRACEGILLYPRGVNPMVSVSYDNNGNNGGGGSGSMMKGSGGVQASLPYKVIRDGAFRPPVMTQEMLMPLSRQPRTATSAFANPSFPDFAKTIRCGNDTARSVKPIMLKACIRPTATYRIDAPLVEPFEVKYVIKNPTVYAKGAGQSGFRTQDLTTQHVDEPTKGINTDYVSAFAQSNQGSENNIKYQDNSHLDTRKYITDGLYSSVESNKSQNVQIMDIEDVMDLSTQSHVKDIRTTSYTAPFSGHSKDNNHIHSDIELNRRVVMADAMTNKSRNIYHRPEITHVEHTQTQNRPMPSVYSNIGSSNASSGNDVGSRDVKLLQKVNAGGFHSRGNLPTQQRIQEMSDTRDTDRSRMSKQIMDMQLSRH